MKPKWMDGKLALHISSTMPQKSSWLPNEASGAL